MSWTLIWEHLFIVLAASILSVCLGLPLGIWAYVSPKARAVILRVVDLLQTIPSLALLGIIMVFLDPGKLTVILGITLYRKMEEGVFPIRCESVQYGQLVPDPVHKRTVA